MRIVLTTIRFSIGLILILVGLGCGIGGAFAMWSSFGPAPFGPNAEALTRGHRESQRNAGIALFVIAGAASGIGGKLLYPNAKEGVPNNERFDSEKETTAKKTSACKICGVSPLSPSERSTNTCEACQTGTQ